MRKIASANFIQENIVNFQKSTVTVNRLSPFKRDFGEPNLPNSSLSGPVVKNTHHLGTLELINNLRLKTAPY